MTVDEAPRMFQHTVALYRQLYSESVEQNGQRIFEGSLVGAFRAIGVSQSYYSSLYGILKELGSIVVERAGRGGGAKSRVVLYDPPELEPFQSMYRKHLTNSTPYATLALRIENVEGRLPNIDLASYIVDLEQRLQSLEDRVQTLERREG
jgi:hypothetical protein